MFRTRLHSHELVTSALPSSAEVIRDTTPSLLLLSQNPHKAEGRHLSVNFDST